MALEVFVRAIASVVKCGAENWQTAKKNDLVEGRIEANQNFVAKEHVQLIPVSIGSDPTTKKANGQSNLKYVFWHDFLVKF